MNGRKFSDWEFHKREFPGLELFQPFFLRRETGVNINGKCHYFCVILTKIKIYDILVTSSHYHLSTDAFSGCRIVTCGKTDKAKLIDTFSAFMCENA